MMSTIRTVSPTLVACLRQRAQQQSEAVAYRMLEDGERETGRLSYAELDRAARAVASNLLREGASGRTVLLLHPPGLSFLIDFWGCLYAGAIAVPVYPPQRRSLHGLESIVADAEPRWVLAARESTPERERRRQERLTSQIPQLSSARWILSKTESAPVKSSATLPPVEPSQVAFLQYTSGSTSAPRGVKIRHDRLMANLQTLQTAFAHPSGAPVVSWLPLFHDMGLVGQALFGVFTGSPVTLMPPVRFVEKPIRWLRAVSEYGAHTSGAPNFAYDLCVDRISPADCEGLDLSGWRLAFNGAEPISATTLQRFAEKFSAYGFKRRASYPCYGMAEACVFLTGGLRDIEPNVLSFDRATLEQGLARVVSPDEGEALVGCGRTWGGERLRIVHPQTRESLEEGGIGEIWVCGPSVSEGYWQPTPHAREQFSAQLAGVEDDASNANAWLRTGDLGFCHKGELFVSGRRKDLIILQGRNHHPQDIERLLLQHHSEIAPGACVAFSHRVLGREVLVVVAELTRRAVKTADSSLLQALRSTLANCRSLATHAIVLVKPGGVPRTTSGKLQRQRCRGMWLRGELPVVVAEGTATAAQTEGRDGGGDLELTDWVKREVAGLLAVVEVPSLDRTPTALGLNSLQIAELAQRLTACFECEASFVDFLGEDTLEQLIAQLGPARARRVCQPSAAPSATLAPAPFPRRLPMSHGQRALWSVHEREPNSIAYNVHLAVDLRADADAKRLSESFRLLQERHPALRTGFAMVKDQAVQTIYAPARSIAEARQFLDFEESNSENEESLQAATAALVQRPFDLERGPFLRVRLQRRPGGQDSRLLIVMHHISLDFWSLVVLIGDLKSIHRALLEDRPVPEGSGGGDYEGLARLQSQLLAQNSEVLWRYWQRNLSGTLPSLALPLDHSRTTSRYVGGSLPLRVSGELSQRLLELSRGHNTTLFTTLLAAFVATLRTYTGQADTIVGTPTSGRPDESFRDVVGYFVNPVPIRVRGRRGLSFSELLAETRRSVLGALEHAALPFSRLVERLNPTRDANLWPLYQVAFTLQTSHRHSEQELSTLALGEGEGASDWGGLKVRSARLEQRVENFDLKLIFAESAHGLLGSFQFNRGLFEPQTIQRMADHLGALLAEVVETPESDETVLAELARSKTESLKSIRGTAPAEGLPSADLVSVSEALCRLAQSSSTELAVCEAEATLTYAQLWHRANRLAMKLRAASLPAEGKVALLLPRGIDQIVSAVAVLLAGGCYVPIDPKQPDARVSWLLSDSRSHCVLVHSAEARRIAQTGLLCIDPASDDAESELRLAHDQFDAQPIPPVRLAYVLYTSGSTGRPKGVEISHGALLHLVNWHRSEYELKAEDRASQFASVGFDASVWEIWPYLLSGASVHIVPEPLRTEPLEFLRWARAQQLSLAFLPTGIGQLVLAEPTLANTTLRVLLLGGERLGPVAQWQGPPKLRVVNHYGPTECAVVATRSPVTAGPDLPPIGCALPGAVAHLLTPEGRSVPPGASGEIVLGGPGLARGYAGRASLTAEQFVPDPFGPSGARLYRTGDLARTTVSGELAYLGRKDRQAKVRGHRVEPGEIEGVLSELREVSEVAVTAVDSADGDTQLVAYLCPKPEATSAASRGEQAQKHVQDWTELYDETYGEGDEFIGWNHSHDDSPITREHMRQWARATTERIVELAPCDVLEIGAGSGIVLRRLADCCQSYHATDISEQALRRLKALVKGLGTADGTGSQCDYRFTQGAAHQTLRDNATSGVEASVVYDTVILNSVVQYFPSAAYLDDVLARLIHCLPAEGGRIFLGDIRDVDWLFAFHLHAQLLSAAPGSRVDAAERRAINACRREAELCLAPEFFRSLPKRLPSIRSVEVDLKAGSYVNELSRYRYDVVLHVGPAPLEEFSPKFVAWERVGSVESLAALLEGEPRQSHCFNFVPNSRIEPVFDLLDTLENATTTNKQDLRVDQLLLQAAERGAERDKSGPELHELHQLAEELGYRLRVRRPGGDISRTVEVIFRPDELSESRLPIVNCLSETKREQFNEPLAERRRAEWLRGVQVRAAEQLPQYALPAQWFVLETLPRTLSGKLDNGALGELTLSGTAPDGPSASALRGVGTRGKSPQSDLERSVARLWQQVLGVARVAREDNFFHLGGDSILAIRVSSAARQLGISLPARLLFEHQELAPLCTAVEALANDTPPLELDTVRGTPQEGQLTALQKGLWYQAQLQGVGESAYVQQLCFELSGVCDVQALQAAWRWLWTCHPALRTHFPVDGEARPRASHLPPRGDGLPWVQARASTPALVDEWLAKDAELALDLEVGPLCRVALLDRGQAQWTLVWTHHHLLLDGWSAASLAAEVLEAYQAFCRGGSPVAVQRLAVAGYARALQSLPQEPAERYWKAHFESYGVELGNNLTDPAFALQNEPKARSSHVRLSFVLGADTSRRLEQLARVERVSVSTVFEALWALLLSAYTGEARVVFGRVLSGRHLDVEGVESMVGLLLQTVPLALKVESTQSLGDWLRAVQARASAGLAHSHASLADIRRWSDRDAHPELFDSLVAFENYPVGKVLGARYSELFVESAHCRDHTHYPLTLVVRPGGSTTVDLAYARDKFGSVWAQQVLSTLKGVLERVAHNPLSNQCVAALWRAENPESSLLEVSAGVEGTLLSRLQTVVNLYPSRPALVNESQSLSYAELWARVELRAKHLQAWGVRLGQRVVLCLERGAEQIVGQLAVLRLGASYIPLEPSLPHSRVAGIVRRSGTQFVVGESELTSSGLLDASSLTLNGLNALDSETALPPCFEFSGLVAYTIYTSGSTGEPKGVEVTHAHVLRLFESSQEHFEFGPTDVWTQFHSPAFDFSIWELWGALLHGAQALGVTAAVSRDPEAFVKLLQERGVTVLSQTPTAFYGLQAQLQAEKRESAALSQLRYVVFGGEALEPRRLRSWIEGRGPRPARLVNMYGITETTVHVTARTLGNRDCSSSASVIGCPLSDLSLQILGAQQEPLPSGVAGELYVGGLGVANGYLGQASLTALRFLPDPASTQPGARRYRTGDLGVKLETGDWLHLGRVDQQIQLRGHRIELGEVETQIEQTTDGVQAAVVLGRSAAGENRLEAYVAGSPLSARALRQRLAEQLPQYMVPAVVVAVECIPRTENGKLDRARLAELKSTAAARGVGEPSVQPDGLSDLESEVATIWCEVLELTGVEAGDSFFELGGDSITSLRVVSQLAYLQVPIASKDVFEQPRLRGFTALLAARGASAGRVRLGHEEGQQELVGPATAMALTPIQSWWGARALASPNHFNQSLAIDAPDVPEQQLQVALNRVAQRHGAFGLRYDVGVGEHRCVAREHRQWPLRAVDLRLSDPSARRAALLALVQRVQASLDLRNGPVCCALRVAGAGEGSDRLILVAHHWLVDGVSWRILLDDLKAEVAGGGSGVNAQVEHGGHVWARWVRSKFEGDSSDASSWLALDWGQVRALRSDAPSAGNRVADQRMFVAWLDEKATQQLLTSAAAMWDCHINDVLLAALAEALHQCELVAPGRVRVDVEGHGRSDYCDAPDIGGVVGWFTSLYPVLLSTAGAVSLSERVEALAREREALPVAPGTFGALRQFASASVCKSLQDLPSASVSFNYLGQFPEALRGSSPMLGLTDEELALCQELTPVEYGEVGCPHGEANERAHELEINVSVMGQKLYVHWAFAARHRRETVAALANAYSQALRQLALGAGHRTSPVARKDRSNTFGLADELDAGDLDSIFDQLGELDAT